MNLSQIRDGLAEQIEAVAGLRTYRFVPDNPTVPCAIVVPETVEYDTAQGGGHDITFVVLLLAGGVSDRAAQELLDGWLDDTGSLSVKAAVEADATLGSLADSTRVTGVRSYGVRQLAEGGVRYYAAELEVEVLV